METVPIDVNFFFFVKNDYERFSPLLFIVVETKKIKTT